MDIVDGYNVLFRMLPKGASELDREELKEKRESLVDRIQRYADQMNRETVLAFDAPKKPAPWFGEKEVSEYLTVIFSNREGSADELIFRMVRDETSGESVVVVTEDRALTTRLENEGATVEESSSYIERIDVSLEEEVEKKHPGEPPEKYGQEPVEDVEGWMKFFGITSDDDIEDLGGV